MRNRGGEERGLRRRKESGWLGGGWGREVRKVGVEGGQASSGTRALRQRETQRHRHTAHRRTGTQGQRLGVKPTPAQTRGRGRRGPDADGEVRLQQRDALLLRLAHQRHHRPLPPRPPRPPRHVQVARRLRRRLPQTVGGVCVCVCVCVFVFCACVCMCVRARASAPAAYGRYAGAAHRGSVHMYVRTHVCTYTYTYVHIYERLLPHP